MLSIMNSQAQTSAAISMPVIAGVEITTDEAGRFNLNALHKASGGRDAKRPKTWLETKHAQELVEELRQNSALGQEVLNVQKGGVAPGTFAHELLAISYAGWISPAFQLQVNQVFLDYRTGKLQPQWAIPQTFHEALRVAAEQAEQVAILSIENKQQQEQIQSLESLFRQGMTIPQFCKMLNGVNVMKVAERLEERNWLYNESRSGNSKRWRVASYARDRYLTEEQQQIGIHGYDPFIKFTPVLLQAGAVRLYQLYVRNELPMKKDWDGTFTQDKVIKGAA